MNFDFDFVILFESKVGQNRKICHMTNYNRRMEQNEQTYMKVDETKQTFVQDIG